MKLWVKRAAVGLSFAAILSLGTAGIVRCTERTATGMLSDSLVTSKNTKDAAYMIYTSFYGRYLLGQQARQDALAKAEAEAAAKAEAEKKDLDTDLSGKLPDHMERLPDGTYVYHIQKGDTLSEISDTVAYSVDALAILNEIRDVDLIYANSSLRLPTGDTETK